MNPARSNKWKFIIVATALTRRSESRVPASHYNHRHDWFSTASTEATSDASPLHIGRPFRANRRTRQFHAVKADPSFCDVIVCVLIEGARRFWTGICLSDTLQEIRIKVGKPTS
jgi:hypothetical protein